jgi:peptidoglycan DL-endopeptidase CwlO
MSSRSNWCRKSANQPANRSFRRIARVGFLFVCAIGLAVTLTLISLPSSDVAQATPTSTTTVITLTGEAKNQVDSLTGQAQAVEDEINNLDDELERASEAYNQLILRLNQINSDLTTLRQELASVQEQQAQRQEMLAERVVSVYKAGGRDELVQILLLSEGLEDFTNRMRLVSEVAKQDNDLLDNLEDSTSQIQTLLAQIDEQKSQEIATRSQIEDQQEQIEAKLSERQATLAGLNAEISRVVEEERQRQQEEQEQLRLQLEQLASAGGYSGSLPQNGTEVQQQLIETAAAYLGIPYVWGGSSPSQGFDCSGFTRYVYAQHGVTLPHYSVYQSQMGAAVELADIQPGDLLAFGYPVHHVGIYIGDDLFIHAPRTGDVIKISRLSERINSRNDLNQIRRFELQPRVGAPSVG